jgi:hypothetical protein
MEAVRIPMRFGKSSKRIVLLAILIVTLVGAGVFAFYQIQQEELVSFLTQYGAYNPKFKYEPFAVIDVDSLARPAGNFTQGKLVITYSFHLPDNIDNVPYLWLTYVSAPPCNNSGNPSSGSCHQMLLIIANNNVTPPDTEHALYASPLKSFGFELSTDTGEHIEWHLYLFIVTYNGTDDAAYAASITHRYIGCCYGHAL